MDLKSPLFAMIVLFLACGCAQRSWWGRSSDVGKDATLHGVNDELTSCLEQLIASSPASNEYQRPEEVLGVASNLITTIPIQTHLSIGADTTVYKLHVDSSTDNTCLTTTGGIGGRNQKSYGPWPSNNAHVKRLRDLAELPSNSSEIAGAANNNGVNPSPQFSR
jgi:hypothetical protein